MACLLQRAMQLFVFKSISNLPFAPQAVSSIVFLFVLTHQIGIVIHRSKDR